MTEARDPVVVRREIALEREELARAIDGLRTEMTSVKGRVGSRLKVFGAALAAVVVLLAVLRRITLYVVQRLRG